MDFFSMLEENINKKKSLLCVGLDPVVENLENIQDVSDILVKQNKRIIEAVLPYTVCFKPNSAFYEAWGVAGLKALSITINMIPADVPIILDTKRNDIGNTAKAYARAVFEYYRVHATTLNPYMGKQSVEPFLAWPGKALFMLCRTSNPGAEQIQELLVMDKQKKAEAPLYVKIAQQAASWAGNIGLVVAGNDYQALSTIRKLLPQVWILAPGIGTQGGAIEKAVAVGMNKQKKGIIPVVVRSITHDPDPANKAKYYRDKIQEALSG
jgi:orotidine 5'-phosphate decarboxylase subfamily 2